jgi:hypothetical protein
MAETMVESNVSQIPKRRSQEGCYGHRFVFLKRWPKRWSNPTSCKYPKEDRKKVVKDIVLSCRNDGRYQPFLRRVLTHSEGNEKAKAKAKGKRKRKKKKKKKREVKRRPDKKR